MLVFGYKKGDLNGLCQCFPLCSSVLFTVDCRA